MQIFSQIYIYLSIYLSISIYLPNIEQLADKVPSIANISVERQVRHPWDLVQFKDFMGTVVNRTNGPKKGPLL